MKTVFWDRKFMEFILIYGMRCNDKCCQLLWNSQDTSSLHTKQAVQNVSESYVSSAWQHDPHTAWATQELTDSFEWLFCHSSDYDEVKDIVKSCLWEIPRLQSASIFMAVIKKTMTSNYMCKYSFIKYMYFLIFYWALFFYFLRIKNVFMYIFI